jgi:hypothetical protein
MSDFPNGGTSAGRSTGGETATTLLAGAVIGVGLIRGVAGLVAWLTIRSQLAAERIRIPDSAPRMAGRQVRGPLAAFEEAEFIRKTTLKATGGRTYGQLDADDPMARMAMDSSLLRSSLFTSILAFAVAAAEMALGAVLVSAGAALLRLNRRLPAD